MRTVKKWIRSRIMSANGVPSALISLHTAGVASAVCVTSSGTIATSTPESKTICTSEASASDAALPAWPGPRSEPWCRTHWLHARQYRSRPERTRVRSADLRRVCSQRGWGLRTTAGLRADGACLGGLGISEDVELGDGRAIARRHCTAHQHHAPQLALHLQ